MDFVQFMKGLIRVLIACSNRRLEQCFRTSKSLLFLAFFSFCFAKFYVHFYLVLSNYSLLSQKHEELLQDSERCRKGLQKITIKTHRIIFLIFEACLICNTGVVLWGYFHCNTWGDYIWICFLEKTQQRHFNGKSCNHNTTETLLTSTITSLLT